MAWVKAIGRQLLGLFVDDVGFAASILAWVLAIWLIPPRLGMPASWSALLLFGGLAMILIESAARRARR